MMHKLVCVTLLIIVNGIESKVTKTSPPKKVCVIGAGLSGLCSARYLLDAGQQVTVLEASAHVGGTWRYDPRVGTDEYGQTIYTSMYDHLRTNLPKQTMEIPGFPTPETMPSFPTGKEYYRYIQSFADHFDLKKHIKFRREVTSVSREGDGWQVVYRDAHTGETFRDEFDYVFVCVGHHSKPLRPNLPGESLFRGTIIHSHDYRKPEPYADRRVLIVGAGPSAMDIGLYLADYSQTLVHSHHSKIKFKTPFPANYIQKPDVVELTERGARFQDGSFEELDDIIYCTGFEYYYPFLDETSGLRVERKAVTPLHKLVVSIHQPTLLILGLVVRACLVLALDAQARYGAALVAGNFTLPSEEDMMREWKDHVDRLEEQGRSINEIHHLGPEEDKFYANLTAESGIMRVPPVYQSIRNSVLRDVMENLYTYRQYEYHVVDDVKFIRQMRGVLSNKT